MQLKNGRRLGSETISSYGREGTIRSAEIPLSGLGRELASGKGYPVGMSLLQQARRLRECHQGTPTWLWNLRTDLRALPRHRGRICPWPWWPINLTVLFPRALGWQNKVTIQLLRYWIFVTGGLISSPQGKTTIKFFFPERE